MLPRAAGWAAGAAAPRPPPAVGAAAWGAADTNGAAVSDTPFSQTSALFRTSPSVNEDGVEFAGQSIVRVNHTTPSKSGSPRASQLPGTCMSFQSAAISWAAGVRQSGLILPIRSATGCAEYG